MNLENETVLILGGAGLVGRAVARALAPHQPDRLILSSLREPDARAAVEDIAPLHRGEVVPAWGDLFGPHEGRDAGRDSILNDPETRARWIDDLYGELTTDVVERSAFGALLGQERPTVIVDCINTAGALAYQNNFASAAALRRSAQEGHASLEEVEHHLATLYLPQLIRHAQIALEGMKQAGTRVYIKVGTAGTGGMGLNIPFTHSEERPSRMLLAKSSLAGAQTLLLYLMARTPGAPVVKELKPTAAISWKSIGFGTIYRGGRPYPRVDHADPRPVSEAFAEGSPPSWTMADTPLQGVFLDAGENGLFTLGEFEVLTSLGLMEFVTPEEIADNVVREITGAPTGRDVVAALDGATMGPTYRAGVLRAAALARMEELERQHGVEAVAYEMLGPPRLAKLLFEASILRRLFPTDREGADLDPQRTAERALDLVQEDSDLRQRMLSAGLPILEPGGETVLRGPVVHAQPELDGVDEKAVEAGWIDLRALNWARWGERLRAMLAESEARPSLDQGSQADHDPVVSDTRIRPGQLAAWILREEEAGARIKR